ncbi:hypothetical protein FDECE_12552 [Fusarium decemcellulare]|nr:hypothetical protein FDECE_12552 [Fusarium decemcellulare]
MSDDQDATMDSISYMPRLQEHIIDKGRHFANHFTTTAICCPSRVSLWTGKQPHNTNVTDVDPPYGESHLSHPPEEDGNSQRGECELTQQHSGGFPKFIAEGLNSAYLPVWLQEAGYATYYTGKMFNSHTTSNYDSPFLAGWDSNNFLLDPGTYSYLNPIYQKDHEAPVQHHGRHTTDLIQGYATDLIDTALGSGKPFFVTIAPIAPHSNIDANNGGTPIMTAPIPLDRHRYLFPNVRVPRTANFNPDRSSGVSWVAELSQLDDNKVDYLDHFYRQRLRAIQGVDELVEQVVSQLAEAHVLDDTYIIFTSDNGYHLGQHRLPPGKECGFEEDIRVPLYIRGPGINEGSREEEVTAHIDLAPTMFRIAGIEPRDDFDGMPLPSVGAATSDSDVERSRREHVAVEYWGIAIAEGDIGGFDGNGQIVMPNNTYKAMRVKAESYDLYYAVWCNNEHELYDLTTDPGQMHNLYPMHKTSTKNLSRLDHMVARLDSLMMVMKSCKGVTCRRPWKVIHPDQDVDTLDDAMHPDFDDFYQAQTRVSFTKCEPGYILASEGPQVGYQYRGELGWSNWA